jgi:hypothetical protein
MVAFQPVNFRKRARLRFTQPGKERFFLIRRVALSARAEVLQRRFHRIALFAGKSSPLGAVNHRTENAQEALDPPVAVFQHPNGILESAIGLCTNLNRHRFSSWPSSLRLIVA